ncbi:MAG: NADH dehydrogenase (quinone) subunit D [Bacteroidetes bacterium]|nr:NADH dehydrogenase (quinone) subunit D [Bacteroidota bacterium]
MPATSTLDYRKIRQEKIIKTLVNKDLSIQFEDHLENEMILNMGPQHPATHGVLRLLLKLDGESVMQCVPELGYLHRGYEKLAENCSYHEFIPHTDRLDYLSPLMNNTAYVLAVEKLLGIDVPRRTKFIRTIISELARISSHCLFVGSMGMDIGAVTVFLWTFREREKLYDIFENLTGARFTTSYTRIGGLSQDLNPEVLQMMKDFVEQFPEKLNDCEKLLNSNRIFVERTDGVGAISPEDAISIGMTGPNLRATGIEHDMRRVEPYLLYNEFDFDIPTFTGGDCLARYYVRINEMKQSIKILQQALEKIPEGPIHAFEPKKVLPRKERVYTKMEELIQDFMLINYGTEPPVGEIYHAIEGSKGELGFYIQSKGEGQPWRMKIRSPSFCNLQSLPKLVQNSMISDVVAIIGSIDPIMGEADK